MNREDMYEAITNLPDDRIEEAANSSVKHPRIWVRWVALAACVALVAGGAWAFYPDNQTPPLDTTTPSTASPLTTITIEESILDDEVWFEDPSTIEGYYDVKPSVKPIAQVTLPEEYDRLSLLTDEQRPTSEFLQSVGGFSYNTGSTLLGSSTGNQNYSPLSLYYALAITATGSGGNTARQFYDLLGVKNATELTQNCQKLFRLLYRDNEVGKLTLANSIWMNHSAPFTTSFVDTASTKFYAEAFTVDFEDPATAKGMGQWIADKTAGLLSPTFDTDARDLLKIINTVYFKDEWEGGFYDSQTKTDNFHLSSGKTVKADFMNKIEYTNFYRDKGFTRSQLYLKNGFRMFFVLPDEGITPQELVATPDKMELAITGGEEFFGKTTWQVPKFEISSKYEELIDMLKDLGLTDAFGSKADFSLLTPEDAYVDAITQETTISIDEKGVEAAVYTKVDVDKGAMPGEETADMILDRPFLYGIQSPDGSLLFVGICENPVG